MSELNFVSCTTALFGHGLFLESIKRDSIMKALDERCPGFYTHWSNCYFAEFTCSFPM